MYTKKIITGLAIAIFLTIIPKAVLSQSTGILRGTLSDKETGKPVAGANVSLIGTGLWDLTDDSGYFEIKQVPAGIYTLNISHIEYNNIKMTDVRIADDATREINISLTKRKTDLEQKIVVSGKQGIIDRLMLIWRFTSAGS